MKLPLGQALTRRIIGRRRVLLNLLVVTLFCLIVTIYLVIDGSSLHGNKLVDDDVMVVIRDTKEQKEYINKHGIHVIVGQYVGAGALWPDGSPNLTQEILNANNYAPIPKAGEYGLPVYIPEFEANRMKVLYHINKFNIMASDRISVNRSLPDPRKNSCRMKMYDVKKLPDASIIIVFHNEAWSTLVRTVHSILNRTPKNILREIILVDDASERTFLKESLDEYLKTLEVNSKIPMKVIRSQNRTGLIRARLLGAEVAQGKVLTFLDAHCEATIGWLEPLLYRISGDRTRVLCPIIDVINDETFAYAKSFELHWGGINWNMHFRWFPIGQNELRRNRAKNADETTPFKSPIMAGGLFAIDKKYFYEIGSYDNEMDIWGGENIEMSLRIWQCGGRIEIAPCSHVAHLFRKSSPYTFPREGGVATVLYANLARAAEAWMDDHKNFFYQINPVLKKTIFEDAHGNRVKPEAVLKNLDKRLELRKDLKCKGFDWYLENVWPEHFFPAHDRFFGQIKNLKVNQCIQRPNGKGGIGTPVGKVELESCTIETYAPQSFVYLKNGYIMADESVCLDVSYAKEGIPILLLACSESNRQRWKYEPTSKHLVHVQSSLCIDLHANLAKGLTLEKCTDQSSQQWDMVSITWDTMH
ncbi:Polypeptide N-acetylgalactosaminyltransferase 1 [Halotydeus destructor]|nr:Polypeptide N-acetylgalactosaminyltransferase 1 [Halotydeus destructor]